MIESNRSKGGKPRARAGSMLMAAIALASITAAHATSFDYADSSDDHLPFNPGHFVFDADGAWVTGNATVRYNADGTVAIVSGVAPFGDAILSGTPDGGVAQAVAPLVGTPFVLPCQLIKTSSSGSLQWSSNIGPDSCALLATDGDGVLWVATQTTAVGNSLSVFRIDADGSGLRPIAFPPPFLALSVAVSSSGGSYVAGYDPYAHKGQVVALDVNGAIRWQWTDTGASIAVTQIGVDAAGNVYVAGYDGNRNLSIASIDAAGNQRWTAGAAVPGTDRTSGFVVDDDGTMYASVPTLDRTHRVLAKINADGTLAWQSDVPIAGSGISASLLDGHSGLRLAPNGDILVLTDSADTGYSPVTTTLFRFNASGTSQGSSTVTGQPDASAVEVSSMIALPDSSALLTTRSDFNSGGIASIASAATSGMYVAFDTSGHAIPSPLGPTSVAINGYVIDATHADDGTTYLVTQYLLAPVSDHSVGGFNARYALSAISPNGARLWKNEYSGYWQAAHVAVEDDRVCIGGNLAQYWLTTWSTPTPPAGGMPDVRVECHANANGATSWSTVLTPAGVAPAILGGIEMLPGGVIVQSYSPGSGGVAPTEFDVAMLDGGGAVMQTHTVATSAIPLAIGDDGSTLLVNSGGSGDAHASVVRPDGSVAYDVAVASINNIFVGQYLGDGAAEVIGVDASGNLDLIALSPSGSVQWTTTLTTGTTTPTVFSMTLAIDNANAFATLTFGAQQSARGAQIVSVDRGTGAIAWRTSINQPLLESNVAIDSTDGSLTFYALYDHKFGAQSIDRASGAAGTPVYQSCGVPTCTDKTIKGARITPDGALRYAIGILNVTPHPDVPSHAFGIDSIGTVPPPIPVSQPGVAGVWYAPYETGQGFTIDYIAASNTLFMPWFTYTQAGGNNPANRNWFSLQGAAAAGAASANLTIYTNDGGAFVSGTTSAQPVGTATLAFTDCSHGTLGYHFNSDTNGGASGSISLSRLTAAADDCLLADGSTAPVDATPPANGFATNQSGSWYDPGTSGQGIEISITPAANGSNGAMFGAWFTYDPSGASDDPRKQNWFTLQGDLSGTGAGVATVGIFSTLGGTLDSTPATTTVPVGQATITFSGCESATVDYHFDDTSLAHAYRNLSGRLNLIKIGGCSGQ
jgi:hypothetical protein